MEEVIILGSGTGVPSLRRGSPGLLLITKDTKALIDSGSGTLRRILEAGADYRDIDLIFYTHIHPDHTGDLVPYLFACKYASRPRQKDLLFIGGPGFHDHFERLKAIYGSWIEPQSYRLTVKEISETTFSFRDLKINSKSMNHLPGSLGYRVESRDGKTTVVSGDTDYCLNIVNLGREADLLILECSFPDEKRVEGHLTSSLAGRIAAEARCKRLVLTHLYPECDQMNILQECRRWYAGEIIISEDLMRIRII